MKNKIYRVTYKNGTVREFKALSMVLKDNKVYQCTQRYPYSNGIPCVYPANNITNIEEV